MYLRYNNNMKLKVIVIIFIVMFFANISEAKQILPENIQKITTTISATLSGEKGKLYFLCSSGQKCSTEDAVRDYYQNKGYKVMRGEVTFWQGMFEPMLKRAGLGKLRWHDLRHTYASILIAKNAQIKFIQKQLGHSSSKMAIDRYGHLFPETYEQGLKALDDLFVGKNVDLKIAN